MTDEKAKMLEAAISQIEKQHGKGAIMRLGNRDVLVPVSVIPTGALSIDAALGVGGVPRGRVIEIYGPESGGKTTLTLHIIAEAQKMGGRALKFYSSIRLDIRRIQSIKEGDRVVGSRTRAKVVKNKVAAPFREAEFDIVYGEGISREGDLIDLGVEKGVLEKSGTWISFGGERMGQGRENARVFLKENKDIRDKLENTLRKKLEIPIPGNSNAGANGSNGVAHAPAEKPPMKTSAAAAGADASKARPAR